MKAILFDLDGVFYQGDQALPGALATLSWVRAEGIPHCFLTNTSSRPRRAVVAKLAKMGIRVVADDLLTPARAAAAWARQASLQPLALLVAPALETEFEGLKLLPADSEQGAAAVVVGDLGQAWDYATLNRAFRLLMAGDAALVALGMTRYWQADDGLWLDVGPMVSALAYASGRSPLVLGKPAAAFFESAVQRLGVEVEEVLMVGDDIVGDVQGAQRAGLRAALVRSGKFRQTDLDGEVSPDAILTGIGDLPAWWRAHQAGGG